MRIFSFRSRISLVNMNSASWSTLRSDLALSCARSSEPWGPAGLRALTHSGLEGILQALGKSGVVEMENTRKERRGDGR